MRVVVKFIALCIAAGLLVVIVSGCQAKIVTKEVPVEVTRVVEKVVTKEVSKEVTRVITKEVAPKPVAEIPFAQAWLTSGHAKTDSVAFTYWDKANPPVVPKACAKCHSTYGYQDFLGVDGTAAGTVENDAKIGSVITCVACHNQATVAMTSTTFPSGAVIKDLGPEARCMQCHQGRASGKTVDEGINKLGLKDPDQVNKDLAFTNIHYYAAGATLLGGKAIGGYQYAGKTYDAKLDHVEAFDTCTECHDPHTLQVRITACATCHQGVKTADDLKKIRMFGSMVDYDGDGDLKEGVYDEIEGLRGMLYQAIQSYASAKTGVKIAYNKDVYPYFFVDKNGDGKADTDEAKADNRYNAFTPRLARAAYNYQVATKDPGAYAHGGKYIIQLLYDSIEDLNKSLPQPIDLKKAHRIDDGHFAGSETAFRNWDAAGLVPATCSKCHSATGLPVFLRDGANISEKPSNGLKCATCHDSLTKYTRYQVKQVTFPSGATLDTKDPNSNLCLNCHQGRESSVSVDRLVAGIAEDAQSDKLRFLNVHYFAAGATLFGSEAKGAYQYAGKTYVGRNAHVANFSNCTQCHSAHELAVKAEACAGCHQNVKTEDDLVAIRMATTDYDGDGDVKEGLSKEIETLQEALYKAMQEYAVKTTGKGIVYDAHNYPYFFTDSNGNKKADADELKRENGYTAWTPRLLKAAYNYQYSSKDPGAYAHNGKYIIQVLYDSLQSLGQVVPVNMSKMVRP